MNLAVVRITIGPAEGNNCVRIMFILHIVDFRDNFGTGSA